MTPAESTYARKIAEGIVNAMNSDFDYTIEDEEKCQDNFVFIMSKREISNAQLASYPTSEAIDLHPHGKYFARYKNVVEMVRNDEAVFI